MAAAIKTWIQPLPDPDIKQKNPRGHEYQTIIPDEISKVNFRVETKFLVNMSEEI
jgi:hypothetical protein